VLRNQVSGNGYVLSANPNFGLGLLGGVTDNVIEENVVTGNVTGVRIVATAVRNVFRGNVIAGNPPILVANNAPDNAASGFDILNLAPAGANTFDNNTCVTSVNAPCANVKSDTDVLPITNNVGFDVRSVRLGGSITATFSGNNLTNTTYFDVRFHAPGATADAVVLNWQQGATASHVVPVGTALGDWTITGVRAHADSNDHTGPFTPTQRTFSVFMSPFSF
jgi:hypothetical protein